MFEKLRRKPPVSEVDKKTGEPIGKFLAGPDEPATPPQKESGPVVHEYTVEIEATVDRSSIHPYVATCRIYRDDEIDPVHTIKMSSLWSEMIVDQARSRAKRWVEQQKIIDDPIRKTFKIEG